MKTTALTLLFSLTLVTLPSLAESPDPKADPKAHALIDKLIEATGGEEALKKIKTRVVEGSMNMPAQGISITMKMSQMAPNKVYVEQSIPGLMEAKQGFNGEKGWSQDTLLGYRELAGPELEQLKRESNIERELNLKKDYPVMKVLPDAELEGRKLHVVEATSKDKRKETWYLDAETGLLSKMEQKMSLGPQGEIDVTILLKDYREVDGIQIPMTSEIKNPAFSATLKFTSVKHNVELDAKIFEAPEEEKEEGGDGDSPEE